VVEAAGTRPGARPLLPRQWRQPAEPTTPRARLVGRRAGRADRQLSRLFRLDGRAVRAGIRLDALAARDWLASYEPARIVLYGESLGTGVAVWLATERPVAGIILDAPYTSTADVAQALFRYVPVTLLMRDQFRSIDRIEKLSVPLLMMHGDRDGVIPIAQSKTLFAAANEPKRYVELPDTGHEEVLERGGLAAVRSFLDEVEARLKPAARVSP
jgi:fermentation-respiration switch protein FrsA (DUF1100 family)